MAACLLAAGSVVGYSNVRSASRMNKAVYIFLNQVAQADQLVEQGINVGGLFLEVSPLVSPVTKVILSNVPPFLSNGLLENELSRYGKLVSAIKPIPLGCKDPNLKHVLSFRRQAFIIMENPGDTIDVAWNFSVDGVNCVVFVSSDTMRCFNCGKHGHQRKDCPDKRDKAEARQKKGDAGGGVAKDVVEQGEKGLPVPDPEPSQNVAGPAPQLALQTEKQTTECTVNEGEFTEVKSKKRNKSAAGLSDSVLERSPRAVCREVAELDTASSSKVVEHGGDLQTPLADGPESGPAAVLTCPEEKRESSLTAELPVPDSAEGMEQFVAAERSGEELKQVGFREGCTPAVSLQKTENYCNFLSQVCHTSLKAVLPGNDDADTHGPVAVKVFIGNNGKEVEMQVKASDTVLRVKELLQLEQGGSLGPDISLACAGKPLLDTQKMCDLHTRGPVQLVTFYRCHGG